MSLLSGKQKTMIESSIERLCFLVYYYSDFVFLFTFFFIYILPFGREDKKGSEDGDVNRREIIYLYLEHTLPSLINQIYLQNKRRRIYFLFVFCSLVNMIIFTSIISSMNRIEKLMFCIYI